MELFQAIYGRCSVRHFLPDRDVPAELVEKLLQAACQAPSAGNIQPWRFWVVRDKQVKLRLTEAAYGQSFIDEAPVVIVVSADLEASARRYGVRGRGLYALQDTAAAIQTLLLAAYAEGLGTCWVGAFDEPSASRVLKLPDHLRPVAIVPLGYPAFPARKPSRRDYREVTKFI